MRDRLKHQFSSQTSSLPIHSVKRGTESIFHAENLICNNEQQISKK